MKKVLILEDKLQHRPSGYDHAFSFFSDQADSFADDYISPSEVHALYGLVYDKVCERLGNREFMPFFSCRGVNLLWCFKKELFHSVYWMALKWEILQRVMQKFPEAQFYMPRGTGDADSAQFADLLSMAHPQPLPEVQWIDVATPKKSPPDAMQTSWACWPSTLSLGAINRCRTAVFSDYARSQSVIRLLSKNGCVLFSNAPSLKTIARVFQSGTSLFQIAYRSGKNDPAKKADLFLSELKKAKIFSNSSLGKLDGEPFLQAGLERLFAAELPRLFFEIDGMHHFFTKATQLRSVLLDEDIDPSKNAFCQIAQQYKVKTFVELHGALGARHGLIPLTADRMFVWGEAQKNKLIRWGCPAEKIIVSGCSRYGYYQKLDEPKIRPKIARSIGLDPEKKIMLLAFGPINRWHAWYENRMHRVVSETLEAVQKLCAESTVQLIIKLHPGDEREKYFQEWVKEKRLEGRAVVLKKQDPLLLAKIADVLLVHQSTYAIDGFALDKPVICLEDYWTQLLQEFRDYSVFQYANSEQELYGHAKKLLGGGMVRCPKWATAKKECLNQPGAAPESFVASQLTHV